MPRPSNDLPGTPRKSRMRGSASVDQPVEEVLHPLAAEGDLGTRSACPSRSRNWAIERLALVTIGFWPVIMLRSPTAASSALAFVDRLAEADVDDDLRRRAAPPSGWRSSNSRAAPARPRRGSAGGASRSRAHLHAARPQCRQTRTRRPLSSGLWAVSRRLARCGVPIGMTLADRHRLRAGRGIAAAGSSSSVRSVSVRASARLRVALGDVAALLDDDRGRRQRRRS